MAGKRTGRQVASERGYIVREWTAEDPLEKITHPFTVHPAYGWADLAKAATLDGALIALAKLPTLRRISVTFEAYLPCVATPDQIDGWVSFELHENGSIHNSNPLSEHQLEAFNVSVDSVDEVQ